MALMAPEYLFQPACSKPEYVDSVRGMQNRIRQESDCYSSVAAINGHLHGQRDTFRQRVEALVQTKTVINPSSDLYLIYELLTQGMITQETSSTDIQKALAGYWDEKKKSAPLARLSSDKFRRAS